MDSRIAVGLMPLSASCADSGLQVAGVSVTDLVAEHGTPLIVYDEAHLRARCADVKHAFPDGASYAAKAFLCRSMARLVHDEGLGIDVASGGELAIALAAGVPAAALTVHGNNKSRAEIEQALVAGVSRIVIDSWDDLTRLSDLAAASATTQRVALRVNPDVAAATHRSIMTGHGASKFGVAIGGGQAATLAARVRTTPYLELTGIHVHTGSQISDLSALAGSIGAAAAVARECQVAELIVGGGLAVAYVEGDEAPGVAEWGEVAHAAARASGFVGSILAEPGRTIAAAAAITVYTIGAVKHVGNNSIMLAVDGGISDNPRPALYGSRYQPLLVRHPLLPSAVDPAVYSVVGKNCESSDTFASDVALSAEPRVGDLVFLPVTGAYTYAMSSNYNGLTRPAVIMVGSGTSSLIVRREGIDDLLRSDVFALDRAAQH
ncbi:MAG: diaminopimelate decarboxylase [Candidatus Dormibacter sp.]